MESTIAALNRAHRKGEISGQLGRLGLESQVSPIPGPFMEHHITSRTETLSPLRPEELQTKDN